MVLRLAITQAALAPPGSDERRDALSHEWIAYLASVLPDALVLPMPNRPDGVAAFVADLEIDGAILANGNEWGEAPERDESEYRLVAACRTRRLPVFGVCRGLHALNFLLGGDIERQLATRTSTSHHDRNHRVRLLGEHFTAVAGCKSLEVNSFHNQGVTREGLAKGCTAFALAADDVVEGFHHDDEPILAIQWHPERPSPADSFGRALIGRFFAGGAWWRDRRRRVFLRPPPESVSRSSAGPR